MNLIVKFGTFFINEPGSASIYVKRFYVSNEDNPSDYLHKDLTIHDICGSENMYETKGLAEDAIIRFNYFTRRNLKSLLPDALFEI